MRITEDIMRSGFFWLPNNADRKIPGNLKIQDGGEIKLEILGSFDLDLTDFQKTMSHPRILGHIEKEGFITLDNCLYTNKNISSPGISKSLLDIQWAMFGIHYEENEVPAFNGFSFSVEGLDEWLDISGIKQKMDSQKGTVTIDFASPEEIKFQLRDNLQLSFAFSFSLSDLCSVTERKLSQKAYIKISSEISSVVSPLWGKIERRLLLGLP